MGNAFYLRQIIQDLVDDSDQPLYSQDEIPEADKRVLGVIESPTMNWTWTIYEAEHTHTDDVLMFGRVDGFESELGYFTLSELENPGAACYLVENANSPAMEEMA